jgi:SAM-dependent methyltransferase
MEDVACNLCKSQDIKPVFELYDYLLNRPQVKTRLVECQGCGLIYQSPRPTLKEMDAHYPPEYESYNAIPMGHRSSNLNRIAIQYGINKRIRFVTRYKSGGQILDIGCATGTFLHGMQTKTEWKLKGVEISRHAAEIAQENYGLDVWVGTLEDARFNAETFDAITMWDVLEHLHDPSSTLREIQRILKPDGILVLRVPNIDSRDAQLFRSFWAGLDAPRHTYVFSLNTLGRMLSENGFEVIKANGGTGSYPTFVLSIRFWLTGRQIEKRTISQITRILNHPLTRLISAPLFFFNSLGVRSPQLIMTARKCKPNGR